MHCILNQYSFLPSASSTEEDALESGQGWLGFFDTSPACTLVYQVCFVVCALSLYILFLPCLSRVVSQLSFLDASMQLLVRPAPCIAFAIGDIPGVGGGHQDPLGGPGLPWDHDTVRASWPAPCRPPPPPVMSPSLWRLQQYKGFCPGHGHVSPLAPGSSRSRMCLSHSG